MAHRPITCKCGSQYFLSDLTAHRQRECPDRQLLCRYCHLLVRAGPPSKLAKDLYLNLGLSEHESDCGARTIVCINCQKNVQLKEVQMHAQMHSVDKKTIALGKICTNINCANTLNPQFSNALKLCATCFAPLWSPRHDPDQARLLEKIVTTYHQQLTIGCQRQHCQNRYCFTSSNESECSSSRPMSPTDAALLAFDLLKRGGFAGGSAESPVAFFFCVADETIARRRVHADSLVNMGYSLPLSIKALEECKDDLDRAAAWLITRL